MARPTYTHTQDRLALVLPRQEIARNQGGLACAEGGRVLASLAPA